MVGFSGVVGVAVVPSSRPHDGDAWWLVRLGVEVVVYNVSKPNTNKETIRKAWKEAMKGDVGKPELDVADMVEYVHSCGHFYKQYIQYQQQQGK